METEAHTFPLCIEPATHEDRPFIVRSLLAMLADGGAAGFAIPMAPTGENAEAFFQHILGPAIDEGDPVLIARVDGHPVGALLWAVPRGPFRFSPVIAFGYGCWVDPEFRQIGVSSALRARGIEMLRANGVEAIDGAVDINNTAGIVSAHKAGFVQHSAIMRLTL